MQENRPSELKKEIIKSIIPVNIGYLFSTFVLREEKAWTLNEALSRSGVCVLLNLLVIAAVYGIWHYVRHNIK